MILNKVNETKFRHGNPKIITGYYKSFHLIKIWIGITFFLLKRHKYPSRIHKIITQLLHLRNSFTVHNNYHKLALVDNRIFFNNNYAGWPAKYFHRHVDVEARNIIFDEVTNLENIRMALVAITKKCPLNCQHCYEGPALNKHEELTLDDRKQIIHKLQNAGISMIHLGGGDPMANVNDLEELLLSTKHTSDFWIYTSGYNMTEENATRLKKAGLTGVHISLDHHDPTLHNEFRRNSKAYKWVENAAHNAQKSGLVIALTVCLTKEFCTEENLYTYLMVSKRLGASFMQMLEPRAIGNWAEKDVFLTTDQIDISNKFFEEVNEDPKYKDMPIVQYPSYHQRNSGCPGAGSKYIYIDTDGYLMSCPFCRNKKTRFLDDDHEEAIASMVADGCGKYPIFQ